MRNRTKIWLIIAASLILAGCILFGGAMTMLNWDFSKLSTVEFETNNYKVSENFNNIAIITNTADISMIETDDTVVSVVCYEKSTAKHLVSVDGDTLKIEVSDNQKWYNQIGISFTTPRIEIYIPNRQYASLQIKSSTGNILIPENLKFANIDIAISTGDVTNNASALEFIKIRTTTGDIVTENISSKKITLSTTTGKISATSIDCSGEFSANVKTGKTILSNIHCDSLMTKGTTGSISLNNVIALKQMSIERNTGDINFVDCDASQISAKTSTGNITGSFLSDKVFIAQSDTGHISVPNTTSGGKCEISTDTGNINIKYTN